MTFDHLPQHKKKFDIGLVSRKGSKSGVTVKELKEELAKCEVVCWGCHKKRERRRNQEHEKKILQENELRKQGEIIARVFGVFISIQETREKEARRATKRELDQGASTISMAFEVFKALTPPTIDKNEKAKNLKGFGLSVALGILWTQKREEQNQRALEPREVNPAHQPVWQIIERNHQPFHNPLVDYDEL